MDLPEFGQGNARPNISMSPTGLTDDSLLKLMNWTYPPKFSDEIDKLILELQEQSSERIKILSKV